MEWGNFSSAHILSILAAGLIIVALYFLLRKASQRVQTVVLGILSFSGIAAIIYNLVTWGSPLEYLPLELCSFNAMILPIAVFTRNKTVGNLLMVWSLGALMALVVNNAMATTEIFGWPFNFYYFPHVLEFGIPILLFKLGHVKKDPKCTFSTLGITMAVYTLAHFANLIINANSDVTVNYMFSIDPNTNPMTQLFYTVIPFEYWYMYMILPIVLIYLGIMYLPQILAIIKEKKQAKAAV